MLRAYCRMKSYVHVCSTILDVGSDRLLKRWTFLQHGGLPVVLCFYVFECYIAFPPIANCIEVKVAIAMNGRTEVDDSFRCQSVLGSLRASPERIVVQVY